MTLPRPEPPAEVLDAARARADARAVRDWARADALKAAIEAAGWKVVDSGVDFRLEPAAPPTVEVDGLVRYGSAAAVPSVLDEPPSTAFTVLVVVEDEPAELGALLAALGNHAPAGTQVVVVANDPSPATVAWLERAVAGLAPIGGVPPEVVRTNTRLGRAAARNVGLRRARGAIVVFADPAAEVSGDALTPLADALANPDVAVVGAAGFVTPDLRRYEAAAGPDVDVLDLGWLAFRRADMAALAPEGGPGPLDEKLVTDHHLGAWWSFALRAGPDADRPPRRAVRLHLPVEVPASRSPAGPEERRLAKRAHYRVLDRFRDRPGLRSGSR